MLRIKKWWEIEENLVVEALRGYAPERYGKVDPVCRKETLLKFLLRGKALEKLRRVMLPSYDKKNQCHVKV